MRTIVAACALLMVPGSAAGRSASPEAAGSAYLDVPYVSQTPALCGGAAVAMVLRYWGARQVYAEDFSHLVEESKAGIRGSALVEAVGERGWLALPFAGTGQDVRAHIAKGRPVIALIEAGPDRYHYVVVTGWAGDRVVYHDPARAPFRVLEWERFDRLWSVTGRWALLVVPAGNTAASLEPATEAGPAARPSACEPLVAEGVQHARGGELGEAEVRLQAARHLCPASAAPSRELAGIRFLQERWREAADLAGAAVGLDPDDEHAWRLLATSRFLDGNSQGALAAWNRLSEPRVDLVRISGLTRSRYQVVESWLGISPRELLTAEAMARARRRLAAFPSSQGTHLEYRPVEGALAEVAAVVAERPMLPVGVPSLTAMAVQAAVSREVPFHLTSPTGAGELWNLSWRWYEARPRLAAGVAIPHVGRFRGLIQASGVREQQTYAIAPDAAGATRVIEDRRRIAMSLGDWTLREIRWDVQAGFDRWQAHGAYLSLGAEMDKRLANDRLFGGLRATGWIPAGGAPTFGSFEGAAAWRSAARRPGAPLTARATFQMATHAAPLDVWPGAGTGEGRPVLLRAHPLLRRGVIEGPAFGRRLASAGVEAQRWSRPGAMPAQVGVAVFGDVARAFEPLAPRAGTRTHVDVGAGLRLALPGTRNVLRLDAAIGLRDGRTAVSAGWQLPWGVQ